MKQIDKKYLCYWCMGCNAEEDKDFKPKQRCENFVPGYKNWQEMWRKELKIKKKRDEKD